MRTVIHPAALLLWLQREPGAKLLDHRIRGAWVNAYDFGCILDAARHAGTPPITVARFLHEAGLHVSPVTRDDALRAVLGQGGCLAERLTVAVAQRLGAELITTDNLWH